MESKRVEKIFYNRTHGTQRITISKSKKRADAGAETDHVARRLVFLIYSKV